MCHLKHTWGPNDHESIGLLLQDRAEKTGGTKTDPGGVEVSGFREQDCPPGHLHAEALGMLLLTVNGEEVHNASKKDVIKLIKKVGRPLTLEFGDIEDRVPEDASIQDINILLRLDGIVSNVHVLIQDALAADVAGALGISRDEVHIGQLLGDTGDTVVCLHLVANPTSDLIRLSLEEIKTALNVTLGFLDTRHHDNIKEYVCKDIIRVTKTETTTEIIKARIGCAELHKTACELYQRWENVLNPDILESDPEAVESPEDRCLSEEFNGGQ